MYINLDYQYLVEIDYHYRYLIKQIPQIRTEKPLESEFSFKPSSYQIEGKSKDIEKCIEIFAILYQGLNGLYFPDEIFCTAWMNHRNTIKVIETKHPLDNSTFKDKIELKGANRFVFYFQYNCQLPDGWKFVIKANGNTIQFDNSNFPKSEYTVNCNNMIEYEITQSGNLSNCFGIKITVHCYGLFSNDIITNNKSQILIDLESMKKWNTKADHEIAKYINHKVSNGVTIHYSSEKNSSLSYPIINDLPNDLVDFRIYFINTINQYWSNFISFINLHLDYPKCLSRIGRNSSYLINQYQKKAYMAELLNKTAKAGKAISVTIDMVLALTELSTKFKNPFSSHAVIIQLYNKMKSENPDIFMCKYKNTVKFLNVGYVGERGIDAGGLFRDCLTQSVSSIFNPNIGIVLPITNGVEFVPNPQWKDPQTLDLYRFIGRLMGFSLRTDFSLLFQWAPIIWKGILHLPLVKEDLQYIDPNTFTNINEILNTPDDGFEYVYIDEMCVINNFNGEVVPVIDGGLYTPLTVDNRKEVCEKMWEIRLHEFDVQIEAIRSGLLDVIPEEALYFIDGNELKFCVSGNDEINVEVLKKHTSYTGWKESDIEIQWFWQVFEGLTDEQRSKWIYFVWGRSRLPTTDPWETSYKMKMVLKDHTQLPNSHTCFFTVDYPRYTSLEETESRIMTTIMYGAAAMENG